MALFQKRPEDSANMPLYSYGLTKTLLIIGLGNIGNEYVTTRHNIGFMAIDELATRLDFDPWMSKKDLSSHITIKTVQDHRVILAKPTTYMNNSGTAVQAILHFYKIGAADTIIVHDELDIPFGQIRTRIGGGSAGHNGIKSLPAAISETCGRVRIGIKQPEPTPLDTASFVLQKFTTSEQQHMPALLKETTAILSEYIYSAQLFAETRSFLELH